MRYLFIALLALGFQNVQAQIVSSEQNINGAHREKLSRVAQASESGVLFNQVVRDEESQAWVDEIDVQQKECLGKQRTSLANVLADPAYKEKVSELKLDRWVLMLKDYRNTEVSSDEVIYGPYYGSTFVDEERSANKEHGRLLAFEKVARKKSPTPKAVDAGEVVRSGRIEVVQSGRISEAYDPKEKFIWGTDYRICYRSEFKVQMAAFFAKVGYDIDVIYDGMAFNVVRKKRPTKATTESFRNRVRSIENVFALRPALDPEGPCFYSTEADLKDFIDQSVKDACRLGTVCAEKPEDEMKKILDGGIR